MYNLDGLGLFIITHTTCVCAITDPTIATCNVDIQYDVSLSRFQGVNVNDHNQYLKRLYIYTKDIQCFSAAERMGNNLIQVQEVAAILFICYISLHCIEILTEKKHQYGIF